MAYVAMTAAEEAENLRETEAMLNDASTTRLEDWRGKNWSYVDAVWLRHMVRDWIDDGRRLGKIKPRDRERLEKFTARNRVTIDGGVIDFYDRDTAAMNFARLIRNSKRGRLREPCLTCHSWYVADDDREERKYCSRKCAGSAAQAAKRKRENDRKVKRAQAAIEKYTARPLFAGMDLDWKRYVSKVTGVSKKFLTVAIRAGELVAPEIPSVQTQVQGRSQT
jgi:hypothetical protein